MSTAVRLLGWCDWHLLSPSQPGSFVFCSPHPLLRGLQEPGQAGGVPSPVLLFTLLSCIRTRSFKMLLLSRTGGLSCPWRRLDHLIYGFAGPLVSLLPHRALELA